MLFFLRNRLASFAAAAFWLVKFPVSEEENPLYVTIQNPPIDSTTLIVLQRES